jgi:hypothetical protein
VTSPAKRKGDRSERAVRDYFIARGYECARTYGAGRPDDIGDLVIGARVPLLPDVKARRRSERAAWLDALRVKARRFRVDRRLKVDPLPVLIEPRRSCAIERAYVTVELRNFVDLLDAIGGPRG